MSDELMSLAIFCALFGWSQIGEAHFIRDICEIFHSAWKCGTVSSAESVLVHGGEFLHPIDPLLCMKALWWGVTKIWKNIPKIISKVISTNKIIIIIIFIIIIIIIAGNQYH